MTATSLRTETARSDLYLNRSYHLPPQQQHGNQEWYQEFQASFNSQVMLDRHYLHDIDTHVCIAKLIVVDQRNGNRRPLDDYDNAYLQLILLRECAVPLNFRELPVALLRLHFAGHDRFTRWLKQIPLRDLRLLHRRMQDDGYTTTTTDGEMDERMSASYEQMVHQVKAYLTLALDMCFCSFERTLHRLLTLFRTQPDGHWPSLGLFEAMRTEPYWQNVPWPAGLTAAREEAASQSHRSLLWLACVWRIHVGRVIETLLKPWDRAVVAPTVSGGSASLSDDDREWVVYRLRLFSDTHLDLLTVMVRDRCYDDAELVRTGRLFDAYPNCHRVCCAEELPCFIGYTFDNFKTGSNLKERCTLRDRIGHIVTNKAMPNICKVRNIHRILKRYFKSDKVICDLLKCIVKTVLLANVPYAVSSPDLMARIKINLSFSDEVADRPLTEEEKAHNRREDAEAMKKKKKKPSPQATPDHADKDKTGPSAKRKKKAPVRNKRGAKRSGKGHASNAATRRREEENEEAAAAAAAADEEGDDDDDDDEGDEGDDDEGETNFTRWITKCRHFVLFILKIMLFYTAETSKCFDQLQAKNYKWVQTKEITRAGVGKCIEEISRQCREQPLDAPINWRRIEYIYKKDDYDQKTGIIMKVHTLLLKTTEKVKKDSFENILMKKMTSTEEEMKMQQQQQQQQDTDGQGGKRGRKKGKKRPNTGGGTDADDPYSISHLPFVKKRRVIDEETGEEEQEGITLEEMHKIAWYVAKSGRAIMETKWFQVVGMSRRGVEDLRDWIFCYYEYDIPDNALKSCIADFQRRSMQDYIILKTMLKLIFYYRHEYIFHLPASYPVRQTLALRRLLMLKPWQPTPPELAVSYICPGCLKFANAVVNPSDYDTPMHEKDVLVINRTCKKHTDKPPVAVDEKGKGGGGGDEDEAEDEKNGIINVIDDDSEGDSDDSSSSSGDEDGPGGVGGSTIRYTNKKKRRGRKRKSRTLVKKLYANNEITTETLSTKRSTRIVSSIHHKQSHQQQQQQQNVPHFNTALYEMATGDLHCQRNYRKKRGLLNLNAQEQTFTVLEGVGDGLLIETNVDRSNKRRKLDTHQPLAIEEAAATRPVDEEDEEEAEDDDDELVTFNHENELFFMPSGDTLSMYDAQRLALSTRNSDLLQDLDDSILLNALDATGGVHPSGADGSGGSGGGGAQTKAATAAAASKRKAINKNKIVFTKIANAALTQKFTCATKLVPVDMAGIVINGKVLCCVCGSMTELCNTNWTSYGITCMRHATPSHPADHPVWGLDRYTAKWTEKNLYSLPPIDRICGVAPEDYFRHASLLEGVGPPPKRHHQQYEFYHPADIVRQPETPVEGCDDVVVCHFCRHFRANVYVTAMDHQYRMMKLAICHSCKHVGKSQTNRNNVPFVRHMERYITQRHANNGFLLPSASLPDVGAQCVKSDRASLMNLM